jgi:hypothetical protein
MCFTEVGFLLKHSLETLGVACDMSINDPARDRINIILGWHLLPGTDVLASCNYIPYQLEQLSESVWSALPEPAKAVLYVARDIWDYSEENVRFLRQCGLSARHVPIGYHKSLEQIPRDCTKDIDVLFYGSGGERRQRVLNALAQKTEVKVRALFGVYSKQRDDYISRSKIILNVHFYSAKIFEAVRVSYLLNNGCCIVSETSELYPYTGVEIPMYPYETIAQECLSLLTREKEMERLGEACYRQFTERYPMTECLRKVVARGPF